LKIRNKALSLVLALTMLVGTFVSTAAFAAEEPTWDSNFDSGSIHYHVTDSNFIDKDSGSVEVTYVDSGFDSYEIPQQVTYQDSNYNITAITDEAFDDATASEITAVIKDSNVSLSVGTKGTGYVSLSAAEDGDITAKAIPAAGYHFDGWYQADGQDRVSSALSLALTDDTGYELVAQFQKDVNFISDTNRDLTVNGTYQFKITSKNGLMPTFVVGTAGVFNVKFVQKIDNDYYFKLTAIGTSGARAGIYVNSSKLLVATVGTTASSVKSDTTGAFKVKSGASYTFKLTADKKPTFVAGTSSVFKVVFVKSVGKDYFFKVTAVGKVGAATGFYANSEKTPVTVATISK
jgi:hypothetical protein